MLPKIKNVKMLECGSKKKGKKKKKDDLHLRRIHLFNRFCHEILYGIFICCIIFYFLKLNILLFLKLSNLTWISNTLENFRPITSRYVITTKARVFCENCKLDQAK